MLEEKAPIAQSVSRTRTLVSALTIIKVRTT